MREILDASKEIERFTKYVEFPLKTAVSVQHVDTTILEKEYGAKIIVNKKTYLCDNIGIVDIDGTRYIDFDDNQWTMMNKGMRSD